MYCTEDYRPRAFASATGLRIRLKCIRLLLYISGELPVERQLGQVGDRLGRGEGRCPAAVQISRGAYAGKLNIIAIRHKCSLQKECSCKTRCAEWKHDMALPYTTSSADNWKDGLMLV